MGTSDRSRRLKDVLWLLAFGGAVAIALRLWFGLGPTTNLSDAVPWGLWKILNMVAGVALSTGGFTVGFLVYVLKLERFRPLVKPAILVAFLGYGSSVFALMLDIGLPHRIWHPIVMWNERSFLFEVAWCVMLYFTVTIIELGPALFDRARLHRISHFLHRIAFGVVIVGISLSSLHHSSLGSLFLVTPQRLHPLWFTPRLPWLFILSAMGAGLMVIVLAKLLYARLYDPASVFGSPATARCLGAHASAGPPSAEPRGPDLPMLQHLASLAAAILGIYLVVKLADLWITGAVHALTAWTWESYLYVGETLALAVVPIALVAIPRTRQSLAGLCTAASAAAIGLVWNRLDVGIFGYFSDTGFVYMPSLGEWALSLGVIAAAGLVFLYASESLAIFDDFWRHRESARGRFLPVFDRPSGVWSPILAAGLHRTTLVAVVGVPLAWVTLYPPYRSPEPSTAVVPPRAVDVARTELKIDGDRNGLAVEFPHADHQRRLGGEESCGNCHHLALPEDRATPCSRCHRGMDRSTDIFDHTAHFERVTTKEHLRNANDACVHCHEPGQPKTAQTAKACLECHREDMRPSREPSEGHGLATALAYRGALHHTCISCHRERAEEVNRPTLGDCSHCHDEGVSVFLQAQGTDMTEPGWTVPAHDSLDSSGS
jgi:Ni/Fe-hydrogenase subunit HybB-like protein